MALHFQQTESIHPFDRIEPVILLPSQEPLQTGRAPIMEHVNIGVACPPRINEEPLSGLFVHFSQLVP